jgi:hypothetical protein
MRQDLSKSLGGLNRQFLPLCRRRLLCPEFLQIVKLPAGLLQAVGPIEYQAISFSG